MAMGTGASGNSLRGPRDRDRRTSGLRGIRRARTRRVELEGLESRTLLSVLPPTWRVPWGPAKADGKRDPTPRTDGCAPTQ